MGFRKAFDFKSRSQRAEFWWWVLFTFIAGIVLSFVDTALGTTLLSSGFSLATFIPNLSVTARRLHDTNRSGWWQVMPYALLIVGGIVMGASALGTSVSGAEGFGGGSVILFLLLALGALAAAIVLIVWLATDSDRQTNRFGPSPKYGSQAEVFA